MQLQMMWQTDITYCILWLYHTLAQLPAGHLHLFVFLYVYDVWCMNLWCMYPQCFLWQTNGRTDKVIQGVGYHRQKLSPLYWRGSGDKDMTEILSPSFCRWWLQEEWRHCKGCFPLANYLVAGQTFSKLINLIHERIWSFSSSSSSSILSKRDSWLFKLNKSINICLYWPETA